MDNRVASTELKVAIREAARWYALLLSPSVTRDEQRAWQEWLQQAPSHRLAWQQVEQVQARVTQVPGEVARPALRGAALSRRDLLQRLAMTTLMIPVCLGAWQLAPWQEWQAQYTTGIGEQLSLTLPDGSSLMLNTATAVDVLYSDSIRLLKLYSGELLIQTAPDNHTSDRPFVVETSHGQVLALGTRFIVRSNNDRSDVTVLEKSVRITSFQGTEKRDIGPGQQLSFTSGKLGSAMPAAIHADSWLHGSLVVVDMPLSQLLAELSRYRRGILTSSDEIADLKISGAFPLKDTDRALAAITRGFPVRQRRMTRYWIRLVSA